VRSLRNPVKDQIRLFIVFAIAGIVLATISALSGATRLLYASLGFLLATPYLASLLVYLRKRSKRL